MSPISGRGKRKIPAIPLSFCHGNPLKLWRIFSFHRRDKQNRKHQKTKSDQSPSKSYLLPSTYHFQVHVQYQIMERTIKFQEAGNKALLQRIPVMPVSPEPVNPTSCSCSPLTCCEEKIWHAAPWSLAVSTISTYLFRQSGMLMEWLLIRPAMVKSADQIISNTS